MPDLRSESRIGFLGAGQLDSLVSTGRLSSEAAFVARVVSCVFPFQVNRYVIEQLIDWECVPDDPLYQLFFPQADMLDPQHFGTIAGLIRKKASAAEIQEVVLAIRTQLNPHPGNQVQLNIPLMDDFPVPGVQHKYKETCLVFPSHGQTCHSYCNFCFRWPQFVGKTEWRFQTDRPQTYLEYVRRHTEICDVLFTGGDPLVMSAGRLRTYIYPLLATEFKHVQNIRIGTKSVADWPYRFTSDPDSDDLLRLFEGIVSNGKHLAIMAHYTHPRELSTDVAQEAVRRIRATGAVIRTQGPLVAHVNDSPEVWGRLWNDQVRLGCIPYYMFVVRPTGTSRYYASPLIRALEIFTLASKQASGLAGTVRGPVMSASTGKFLISGIVELQNAQYMVLTILRARKGSCAPRSLLARFSEHSTWLDQLEIASGNLPTQTKE